LFEAFNFAFINELREIKNSWYKLFLITLFPLLSFAFLILIFLKGVATELPIVVVDKDRSDLSKRVLFNINATPTMKIAYKVGSEKEGIALIKSSKAYALVIIPSHFKHDVLLQTQPNVTVMLNTQYILIGKIIKGDLVSSIMGSAGEIEYIKSLHQTQNSEQSLKDVVPIGLQITPFFNTYKNYLLFLISALLPAIWQIFIVVATVVSFGTLFKQGDEREFFKGGFVEMKILGKLFPYTLAFMLLGILFLFFIYGTLGWVFQGSWAIMLFALFLTTVAYQVVALLFFVTGFDYARSLSLGAVYTAPAFAFLGVTFPVESMNGFALFWRDLLPISYYMEVQISQANYGADIFLSVDNLLTLASFSLLLIPIFWRFRKRLVV
jgi:ABC-2 type transport system permease protein